MKTIGIVILCSHFASCAPPTFAWREDTARIDAEITILTPDELGLRLALTDDIREERYRYSADARVCPDLR